MGVFENTMDHSLNPPQSHIFAFSFVIPRATFRPELLLSSLCPSFSNYFRPQLYYFSSYKDSIKIDFIKLNCIFQSGIGSIFYFSSALREMEKLIKTVFLSDDALWAFRLSIDLNKLIDIGRTGKIKADPL